MNSSNIVVVYHPDCKASMDFLIKVSKLQNTELEFINIKEDKIETDISVDIVPLIIIDNDPSKIYKGKIAFDKIEDLIKNNSELKKATSSGGGTYNKKVSFIEQTTKKEKIDLSKK